MLKNLVKKDSVKERIENEILSNFACLEFIKDVDSETYSKVLRNIERLQDLKRKDRKSLDPNSCLVVAGNLIGILLILGYEQKDFIRSKALGFVLRGRV